MVDSNFCFPRATEMWWDVRCHRPAGVEKSERRGRRREVVAAPARMASGPGDLFVTGRVEHGTKVQSEKLAVIFASCGLVFAGSRFCFLRSVAACIFWKLAGLWLLDGDPGKELKKQVTCGFTSLLLKNLKCWSPWNCGSEF